MAEHRRVAALQVVRGQEVARRGRDAVAEAGGVERRDPVRPVRQVEARAEEVVAVPRDLRQDLAEAECHDRQVVAAETQRRESDHDPDQRGEDACKEDQDPYRDMDPGQLRVDADRAEMPGRVRELQRGEPGGRVGAGGVEGDVAEIEQPRVADDDVQADGHDHVHAHDHGRVDVGERAEPAHVGEVPVVERIQHCDEQDERWNREPSKEGDVLRQVRKRVLHAKDDDHEHRKRPGGRVDEDGDEKRPQDDSRLEAVLQASARTGTLIEINADPQRLDLDWVHCKRAKALGVKLVINPDAHSTEELGLYPFGVDVARRGWLGKENVFNTQTLEQVTKVRPEPCLLPYGRYREGRESTEEDFKIAEWRGEPEPGEQ